MGEVISRCGHRPRVLSASKAGTDMVLKASEGQLNVGVIKDTQKTSMVGFVATAVIWSNTSKYKHQLHNTGCVGSGCGAVV